MQIFLRVTLVGLVLCGVYSGTVVANPPGVMQPIVDAFGSTTKNGKVLSMLASGEGQELWLLRGIPFYMGSRFAEMENLVGGVVVSAWLHEGFPKGQSNWFEFAVLAKGLSSDQVNRIERNRKLGQVIGLISTIVPQAARHNMKRVLDTLPCTAEPAVDFGILLQRYGESRHYQAILERTPDLRGGPTIGIALSKEWTLEVRCHSSLGRPPAVFLSLVQGQNDTKPFAECYSEFGQCWEHWPQYDPFGVRADQ